MRSALTRHAAMGALIAAALGSSGFACEPDYSHPKSTLLKAGGKALDVCGSQPVVPACTPVAGRTIRQAACLPSPEGSVATAFEVLQTTWGRDRQAVQGALATAYTTTTTRPLPVTPPVPAAKNPHDRELLDRGELDQQVIREAIRLNRAPKSLETDAAIFWLTMEQCELLQANDRFLHDYMQSLKGFPEDAERRSALLILVQHSDDEALRQRIVEDTMKAFLKEGKPLPEEIGSMADRIEIDRGRGQLFGSRFDCKDGQVILSPDLQSAAKTAALRQQFHMEPIEKVLGYMESGCKRRPPGG